MIMLTNTLIYVGLAVMGLVFLILAFTVTKTLSSTIREKREIDRKRKLKEEKKNDEEK